MSSNEQAHHITFIFKSYKLQRKPQNPIFIKIYDHLILCNMSMIIIYSYYNRLYYI